MSGAKIIRYSILLVVLAGSLIYASRFSTEVKFISPFTLIPSYPEVSILVTGDMMLDRNVRNTINKYGFDAFFAGVKDVIAHADIAVVNLEGPFTPHPSVTASLVSKELRFTFDPALAPKLADLGFDIIGLANNHTLNFGTEGLESTRDYIREAGMLYYGEPDNRDELSVVTEHDGIKVGFVGFHEFSYINYTKVFAEIEKIRPSVDFLIVSPHWGTEYEKAPTEKMREWAHAFIDSGADAVIGAHPHVIGETEEYKGRKIYYSLGNFVFDQYFSKETSEGLMVKIDLVKENTIIKDNYTLMRVKIDRQGVSVSE